MANFCGKCGSRLDIDTGLCPNCDAAKIQQYHERTTKDTTPVRKEENVDKRAKKKALKARKKSVKKEKQANWSIGKKVRRFFLKLLLVVILLVVLIVGVTGALVYFDVVNIPIVERIITQLEFGSDKSTDDLYFQSLSNGFTDRKITDRHSALEALEDVADVIGIENVKEEFVTCEENTVSGNMYYRFHQEYRGIPVYGRSVVIVADENGNSLSLSGNYLNIEDINTTPIINEAAALEIAHQHYGKDAIISSDGLSIYSFGDSTNELTWVLNVRINQAMESCILSANSGSIIQKINLFDGYSNQEVLDSIGAEYSMNENGEILLSDETRCIKAVQINQGDIDDNREIETLPLTTCRADEDCNEYTVALKNLTIAYDFFKNYLELNSFNGQGGDIYLIFCDEDMNIENAMGNGHNEHGYLMIGNPNKLFTEPIGNALDIIGHEYTHMVAHQIVNFIDYAEQNAISEGISDVIGNLIEIHTYGVEDEIWNLGESAGYSKYSMADFVDMTTFDESDTDGHNNAAIISHAAYLMWKGIDGSDAFESLNEEELAHLFYETLYTLPADCTFEQFRTLLQNTADIMCLQGRLSKKQYYCVSNAMFQVGINRAATPVSGNHLSIEVYDIKNLIYDDYTLYVRHENNEEKYDGKYISEHGLTFAKPGEYQLRIVDNANTDNETIIDVTAVERGGVENLPLFTRCGVSKPEELLGFNEEENVLERYLAAAAKTTETGSWSEQLTLEADMSIAYNSGKTKTVVTLTADSDVSNYVEDDLSQIEITSLANMKVMGQTYAWSTEYYDGVAHYEYTEPFQRSESMEIPPDFFNFESSIPEEAILTEEISGNKIRFIVSGEKMTETGIAAVQQISGVNDLECEDVEVIATLNDSGGINQIEMNFDATVKYQGYDADVTYKIHYIFN